MVEICPLFNTDTEGNCHYYNHNPYGGRSIQNTCNLWRPTYSCMDSMGDTNRKLLMSGKYFCPHDYPKQVRQAEEKAKKEEEDQKKRQEFWIKKHMETYKDNQTKELETKIKKNSEKE